MDGLFLIHGKNSSTSYNTPKESRCYTIMTNRIMATAHETVKVINTYL